MKKISIREFFETPDYMQYRLSPDGKKLAYKKKIDQRANLFVKDLETHKEVQLTAFTDRSIQGYSWLDNDHLRFLKDVGGDENSHLYIVDLKTNSYEDVTPWEGVKVIGAGAYIEDVFYYKKEQYKDLMEVTHNNRSKQYFDTYIYNFITKEWKMKIKNDINISDVAENKNHELIYRTITIEGGSYIEKINDKGEWNKIKEWSSKDEFSIDHIYDDGTVLAVSNINRDKLSVLKYQADLKEESAELIYEDDTVDVGSVAIDTRENDDLVLIYLDKDYPVYKWYKQSKKDEYDANVERLHHAYPDTKGDFITYVSQDVHRTKLIMAAQSDKSLLRIYFYDKATNKIVELNPKHTNLTPQNLASMKPISFTARDGLTIHGYMTLPKNFTKAVPFVVLVHGGPWARDDWGYDSEVQFLANRGYGVIQINFRISTGYGKKFFTAGWKQWGLAMQDDVTDATNWIIDNGYAIKDKIAIMGGSYGGYATLMGIIKEPDLYAAAIDIVGVSDLFALWDSMPIYWRTPGMIFEEALGDPYKNEEYARSVSPVFHADKIKTPLFVIQGANDPRVPLNQAELIVAALKKRNIDVEYLVKDDEGHGFANEENRFEMYELVEEFLAKHLK